MSKANPNNEGAVERQQPSRREFLMAGAAVAGGAMLATGGAQAQTIGPESTRPIPRSGKRAPLGPNDPIKLGVIGVGGMGSGHCGAMMGLREAGQANVEVVALCDVCEPRWSNALEMLRKRQPGVAVDTYTKHEDLVAREDLHGVIVASTEHWHAQHVGDAMAAGKDVYCEKPMTLRMPEALWLREAVRRNPDIIVQVGTQQMMLPKFDAARQMIKDGRIGKPTFSQTSYCRNSKEGEWLYYSIDPSWEPGVNLDWERWCGPLGVEPWDPEVYARWRRYRKYSTGIVGDLLVHVMTPMMHSLDAGWPTHVTATGGHYVDKAMENHDQVNINVQFESEHTMVVAGSTSNEVGLETMIRGHKGNIYLGGRHCQMRPERLYVDDVEAETVESPDIGNDQNALRMDWLNSIRTRQPNRSPVELGTKVMVVVDLATRSMWDGHSYRFDPKTLTARRV